MKKIITFNEFKKHFIDHPDGFFSVYSSFDEDDEGNFLKVINLVFICEWRMADKPPMFYSVLFDTEDEFNQIVEYLKVTADLLNKSILSHIEDMRFEDVKDETAN